MIAYNNVIVMGVLTRNPDIKTVGKNGMKLAVLSLCINEKRKTQDGKFVDNPVFVDVDAWSRLAETCEKYLVKNSNVFVEGTLQMAQWEKDGVKHQKLKIRAKNIKFLPKGERRREARKSDSKDVFKENKGFQVENDNKDEVVDVFVPEETPEMNQEEGFEEAFSRF